MIRSLLGGYRHRRALKPEGRAGTKTQWRDSAECSHKARGHVRLERRDRWHRMCMCEGEGCRTHMECQAEELGLCPEDNGKPWQGLSREGHGLS